MADTMNELTLMEGFDEDCIQIHKDPPPEYSDSSNASEMDTNGIPPGVSMGTSIASGTSTKDLVLISQDSLKHGFYEQPGVVVIRVTHRDIFIEEVILSAADIAVTFSSSNRLDLLLGRHRPTADCRYLWTVPLAGCVCPESLEISRSGSGWELKMQKGDSAQWGRLSSSTSSIRSSNYSVPRSYGPSLSSYRYSASSYTPGSRSSTSSTSSYKPPESGYSSLTRSSTAAGSALARSSSSSAYNRTPYQSPAASRTSSSVYSAASYASTVASPSHSVSRDRYSLSNASTTDRYSSSNNTNAESSSSSSYSSSTLPTVTPRSRSSSALSTYRNVNVRELNHMAAARADREQKDREYKEWEERERIREHEDPAPPLVRDFRKKVGSSGGSIASAGSSAGYSQFARSVTSRSEVPAQTSDAPKYVPTAPYSYKPTATVQPMEDRERITPAVQLGFTGLRNIGNTCFMNATLQMLVNNIELRTYFLDKHYKLDVNACNPLGFKGRLADAFADFMRSMWNCQNRAIEPIKIKELVAEKASQFANFAQHDAHEFLSFLLDGLHEDVNRVKTKPLTSTVEGDGRADFEVSEEAWHNHLLRNDSIFVDLFHGQLKSRLQCPSCSKISITFDPFVYLPVPFPKTKKTLQVYFWPVDPHLKPIKLSVAFSPDGTVLDVLTVVADLVRAPAKNLRLVEVFAHRVQKTYAAKDFASSISSGDLLYVFQVHDAADCNEPVVELFVVQRQLYHSSLRYACSTCGKSTGKLKACEACYNAYYCNQECQLADWNSGSHKEDCKRRSQNEAVGQPFVVSLPQSQLTQQQLLRIVEPRARCSVEVFMPPVSTGPGGDDSEPPTRSGSECSDRTQLGAPPSIHHVNAKSPSPSPSPQANTVNAGATPRRQTVMPEPRRRPDNRIFQLRLLKDQTHCMGEPIPADKTGDPLNIPTGSYISINYYNMKAGKSYIQAESRRHLDIDEEKTAKLASYTTNSSSNGGDPSLEEMLNIFSETEYLKPEESWYCNKCKNHVEATKKLDIFRLPPVLIVQLKRFVYTATYQTMHRRSKDERRVVYPLQGLDLAPYLADSAPDGQTTIYDLTGVVCHSGSSYFGHYVSVGRLAGFDSTQTEVDWRTFDDSIVSRQSAAGAQSDDAYLLFYKQRDKTTRHIFRKHYSCDPTTKTEDVVMAKPQEEQFNFDKEEKSIKEPSIGL